MNDVKPAINTWPVTRIEQIKRDQRKFKDSRQKPREGTEKRRESERENKIDDYA